MPEPSVTIAKRLEPFVCGGSAATFASCVIHPMDLAKVRMQIYGQLNPGKPIPGFHTILGNLIQNDGVSSLYKGVDAAIGRQLVYGTARIGLHRTFSDYLVALNDNKPISFLQKTLSGMASGSIAVCIGTPFDIALVRLQSDGMADPAQRRNYKNVFDALIRTTKEEGVGALYKGLAPNILRGMSMNVGMLACCTYLCLVCCECHMLLVHFSWYLTSTLYLLLFLLFFYNRRPGQGGGRGPSG